VSDGRRLAAAPALPESRNRAAAALRRLGHALVAHEADADLLDRIAELADRTAALVTAGRPRSRPVSEIKRRLWEDLPVDGERMAHFAECVVSGQANPLGIAIDVVRDGDEVVATTRLGAAFEGAPQRAHGGVVAAIFDDVLGYVLLLTRTPAFTGRLTVHYRAPTPLGRELVCRARQIARDGRKITMTGELHDGDLLVAEAEAVFIAIPPERLGLPADGRDASS